MKKAKIKLLINPINYYFLVWLCHFNNKKIFDFFGWVHVAWIFEGKKCVHKIYFRDV